MSNATRILVIDDHQLVRDVLAAALAAESDFEVVGTACNAADGLSLAIEHQPDIVLMDIDMPGAECFDVARTIGLRTPCARVIFVSGFVHDRYIEAALELAVTVGYVTKREPPQVLVEAIRAAARGETFFSPDVQERIVVHDDGPQLAQPRRTRAQSLTERELAVLRRVAGGLTQKEIGEALSLSHKTVNFHITNIMNKLEIHDRVGLARFAIAEGLIHA